MSATSTLHQFVAARLGEGVTSLHDEASRIVDLMPEADLREHLRHAVMGIVAELRPRPVVVRVVTEPPNNRDGVVRVVTEPPNNREGVVRVVTERKPDNFTRQNRFREQWLAHRENGESAAVVDLDATNDGDAR